VEEERGGGGEGGEGGREGGRGKLSFFAGSGQEREKEGREGGREGGTYSIYDNFYRKAQFVLLGRKPRR